MSFISLGVHITQKIFYVKSLENYTLCCFFLKHNFCKKIKIKIPILQNFKTFTSQISQSLMQNICTITISKISYKEWSFTYFEATNSKLAFAIKIFQRSIEMRFLIKSRMRLTCMKTQTYPVSNLRLLLPIPDTYFTSYVIPRYHHTFIYYRICTKPFSSRCHMKITLEIQLVLHMNKNQIFIKTDEICS